VVVVSSATGVRFVPVPHAAVASAPAARAASTARGRRRGMDQEDNRDVIVPTSALD
jgi:hypothetical protein